MREPYLRRKPPKSAGREQFGQPYAHELLAWGHRHHAGPADIVRTATVFTALSIADAFRRLILPRTAVDELIVTGGGAKNPLIMAQLAAAIPGIEIIPPTRFGVPPEAKEAFAFAVLAYETYHGRPSNVPSATGARHRWCSARSCMRPSAGPAWRRRKEPQARRQRRRRTSELNFANPRKTSREEARGQSAPGIFRACGGARRRACCAAAARARLRRTSRAPSIS